MNSGPLEEQSVLLTDEPSLQLLFPRITPLYFQLPQVNSFPSLCPSTWSSHLAISLSATEGGTETIGKGPSFSRAVVAHAFNPSSQETEAGGSLFKASLVYRVSSRTAKATQINPVLKNQKQEKKRKKRGERSTSESFFP